MEAGLEAATRSLCLDEPVLFGRSPLKEIKLSFLEKSMTRIRVDMRKYRWKLEEAQYRDRAAERAYSDLRASVAARRAVLERAGAPSAAKVPQAVVSMSRKSVPAAFDVSYVVGKEYLNVVSSIMAKMDGGPKVFLERDSLYPGMAITLSHKLTP